MKTLFLAWQDQATRRWFPIGMLRREDELYQFRYVHGAVVARKEFGFRPLESFPDISTTYESEQLFPLFSNRLPSKSRPDFDEFVRWLNAPAHEDDPIALLARSGGRRATDKFEVFPCPEKDSLGNYHVHFLVHGLRHQAKEALDRILTLVPGERLLLAHDFQNPYDRSALLIRTNDTYPGDRYFVGYCPRYLLDDAFRVLIEDPTRVTLEVERVNRPPAPLDVRLLCSMTATWPPNFRPFASPLYRAVPARNASRARS